MVDFLLVSEANMEKLARYPSSFIVIYSIYCLYQPGVQKQDGNWFGTKQRDQFAHSERIQNDVFQTYPNLTLYGISVALVYRRLDEIGLLTWVTEVFAERTP